MASIDVKAPAVIKIKNLSSSAKTFAPYKENFISAIAGNGVLEFKVKTSGQVLYYLGQATKDLEVSVLSDFDAEGVQISCPEIITIANSSERVISFVPYRENFEYAVKAGDSVQITAETVGQVLYYLAQATEGLSINHASAE